MDCIRIGEDRFEDLAALQKAYKAEIGEDVPAKAQLDALRAAIEEGRILFYGILDGERLAGCCSVSITFSTFQYANCGVFEDFYILPEYRRKGLARRLVRYAFLDSGVASLTVGSAQCDEAMYASLGFSVPLGRLMAMDGEP